MSDKSSPAEITAQTASGAVVVKLLIFSLSLGIAPVASYFGSLKYLWNGNATYAAITAVAAANVVLVLFIISAVREDRRQASAETPTVHVGSKKER